MERLLEPHRVDLARLAARGRLRSLRRREGIDFASNDYLALAAGARLKSAIEAALARGVPIGSGGSRLLRGNDPEHEALEAEAAACFGAEAALFFASGYAANVTALATLPQRGDLIVHDALIHASAHEGMRLSRTEARAARHNDPDDVDAVIAAWRGQGGTGTAWIVVESLYSMDGDCAPLNELAHVAARHDAFLIVDEAHATGVFGAGGRGLAEELHGGGNLITLHTCGKALGCEGALLCLPVVLRDFLVNRGRGFIFSTAPSPLMAAAVRDALRCLNEEPERRALLWERIGLAERALARCGVAATGSQILPLIVGNDGAAVRLAEQVQAAGFDVRAIRPPTVPNGTARLRISVTLNAGADDIDALADAIAEARA